MPSWPHYPGCQAGPHTFTNGEAVAGTGTDGEYDYQFGPVAPIYANLDGQAGDEALVTVICNGGAANGVYQLLALKSEPGGTLTAIGAPNITVTKVYDYDQYDVAVSGRVISLETEGVHNGSGTPSGPKQLRGYRYENGAFQLISGPTQDATWPTDTLGLDLANSTLSVLSPTANGVQNYLVRFVGGVGKQTVPIDPQNPGAGTRTYTFNQGKVVPITGNEGDNEDVVLITRHGPDGDKVVLYWVKAVAGTATTAKIVVRVGDDGITGIVDYSWTPGGYGGLFITVTTATGQEKRRYVEEESYNIWFHNELK
jgi:hypothetical protein